MHTHALSATFAFAEKRMPNCALKLGSLLDPHLVDRYLEGIGAIRWGREWACVVLPLPSGHLLEHDLKPQ